MYVCMDGWKNGLVWPIKAKNNANPEKILYIDFLTVYQPYWCTLSEYKSSKGFSLGKNFYGSSFKRHTFVKKVGKNV